MRRLEFSVFLALFLPLPISAGVPPSLGGGAGCDFLVSIRFDDQVAPSELADTEPLSTEYGNLGITFAGPGQGQGGAMLNDRSGFGVLGYSTPNFLAFDARTYAVGPETLFFFTPAFFVELQAGSSDGGTLTLECFDDKGALLGTASAPASPALQTLRVDGPFIDRCTFEFTGQTAVVDDIVFHPCDGIPGEGGNDFSLEVPALDPSRLVLFAVLVAAAALAMLARRA